MLLIVCSLLIPVLLSCLSSTSGTMSSIPTIVFIGASETSGYGLPKNSSYVAKFSRMLKEGGYDYNVKNISYPGAATSDGVSMLLPVLNSRANIQSVFISLGLSDCVYGVDPEVIYTNLLELATLIKSKHPMAKVFIMEGEIFQYHVLPNLPKHNSEYYGEYKGVYERLGQKKNITIYPFLLQSFLDNPGYFLSDEVHPNERGTLAMAEFIFTYFLANIKNE